jgi:hypothetical protein
MIDDFKPSNKKAGSLQKSLDETNLAGAQPPLTSPSADQSDSQTSLADNKAIDFMIDESLVNNNLPDSGNQDKEDKVKRISKFKLPKTKKARAAIFIVLVAIIGSAVVYGLSGNNKKPDVIHSVIARSPTSSLVPSTLSGLQVAPNLNKQAVTGAMIENSTQARPQSGLSQAGVVFEALAEGGITRFLALYQDTAPANIGPIRSVRPYYLQWALGFDASIAHVGGSTDALNDIKTWNVKDLNQFYNAGSYHRITTREAPHNVYTSIADLNQLEAKKDFNTVNFSGFPRKADSPSKMPTATSINLSISSADYNVHYDYSSTTNSYNRSEGGQPMLDANSNDQLSPKVVIGIVVPLSQGALDSSDAYYSVYNVIGSGKAYIFQDGIVSIGNWTKVSNTGQLKFTSASGSTIKLNAGQTWITAASNPAEITYAS